MPKASSGASKPKRLNKNNALVRLPHEVILEICTHLCGTDVAALSRSCRRLSWLSSDLLWRSVCERDGYLPLNESAEVSDGNWRRHWWTSRRESTALLINSEAAFEDIQTVFSRLFADMSPDDAATLTIGAHLNGKITIFRGSPSDGLMLRRRSFQLSREVQHEQRQGEMGADHIVDWATRATYAGIPFAFHVVVPTASFESKDFVQFVSTSPAVFPKLKEDIANESVYEYLELCPRSVIITEAPLAECRALAAEVNAQFKGTPIVATISDARRNRLAPPM